MVNLPDSAYKEVIACYEEILKNLTAACPTGIVYRPCDVPDGMSAEEWIAKTFVWESLL